MSWSTQETTELVRWGLSILVPAISGLGGVAIGAWLTARQGRKQRKYAFVEKQLREFYSPLLGIRLEIRMRSELRARIHTVANNQWKKLCAEAREAGGPDQLRKLSDERFPEFKRLTEYDNRQLTEELLPAYRQMIDIFRKNLWLAEPETQRHFGKLVEFIDLWDRWIDKAIPPEVIEALQHGEESLYPFYEHLEQAHRELQGMIKSGET